MNGNVNPFEPCALQDSMSPRPSTPAGPGVRRKRGPFAPKRNRRSSNPSIRRLGRPNESGGHPKRNDGDVRAGFDVEPARRGTADGSEGCPRDVLRPRHPRFGRPGLARRHPFAATLLRAVGGRRRFHHWHLVSPSPDVVRPSWLDGGCSGRGGVGRLVRADHERRHPLVGVSGKWTKLAACRPAMSPAIRGVSARKEMTAEFPTFSEDVRAGGTSLVPAHGRYGHRGGRSTTGKRTRQGVSRLASVGHATGESGALRFGARRIGVGSSACGTSQSESGPAALGQRLAESQLGSLRHGELPAIQLAIGT